VNREEPRPDPQNESTADAGTYWLASEDGEHLWRIRVVRDSGHAGSQWSWEVERDNRIVPHGGAGAGSWWATSTHALDAACTYCREYDREHPDAE
jgi:hypothetical protein